MLFQRHRSVESGIDFKDEMVLIGIVDSNWEQIAHILALLASAGVHDRSSLNANEQYTRQKVFDICKDAEEHPADLFQLLVCIISFQAHQDFNPLSLALTMTSLVEGHFTAWKLRVHPIFESSGWCFGRASGSH
jgi:hypothetical protein